MAITVLRKQSARLMHDAQQIHYLYARFNGFDIPTDVTSPGRFYLGVLPANSYPLDAIVRVNTAFTSGEVIVGTSAAGSSAVVVSTADVVNTVTGSYESDRYRGTLSTVDVPLFIQTKSSGQTNGQVDIWLTYLPAFPST